MNIYVIYNDLPIPIEWNLLRSGAISTAGLELQPFELTPDKGELRSSEFNILSNIN